MYERTDDFESSPFDDPMDAEDVGSLDLEADVTCPYCGEIVTIGLDPGSGPDQSYVEDCQVCCRPWRVHVSYDDRGTAHAWVEVA